MRTQLKKTTLTILPLAGLLFAVPVVSAYDQKHRAEHRGLNAEHQAEHQGLNAEHWSAHTQPMTRRQHRRAHRQLSHAERAEHQGLNAEHQELDAGHQEYHTFNQ